MLSILSLDSAEEVAILLQPALYDRVRVLPLLDEARLGIIRDIVYQQIVVLQFNWVETSLLNLFID